mmetsp:Transcript_72416/g.189788  ORF Transcript_72416/g.189788 Transcript_72416/m.189788 type:complete len:879 (-) Transcript_72416:37-2673(-)
MAAQEADDLARGRQAEEVVAEPGHDVVEAGRLPAREDDADAQRARQGVFGRAPPPVDVVRVLPHWDEAHGAHLRVRDWEGLGQVHVGVARLGADVLLLGSDARLEVAGNLGHVAEALLLQVAEVLPNADVAHHQDRRPADYDRGRQRHDRLDHLLQLVQADVLGQKCEGPVRHGAELARVAELHGPGRLEDVALHPGVAEEAVCLLELLPQPPPHLRDLLRRPAHPLPLAAGLRVEEGEGDGARLPVLHRLVHACAARDVERALLADERRGRVSELVPVGAVEGRGQRRAAHELRGVEARGDDGLALRPLQRLLHEAPQDALGLQVSRQEGQAVGVAVADEEGLDQPGQPLEELLGLGRLEQLLPNFVPRGELSRGLPGAAVVGVPQHLDQLLLQDVHLRQRLNHLLAQEDHAGWAPDDFPALHDLLEPVHRVLQRHALVLAAVLVPPLLHGEHGEVAPGLQRDLHGERVLAAPDEVPVLVRAQRVHEDVARDLAKDPPRAVEPERDGQEPRHVEVQVLAVRHTHHRRGAARDPGEVRRQRRRPGEVPRAADHDDTVEPLLGADRGRAARVLHAVLGQAAAFATSPMLQVLPAADVEAAHHLVPKQLGYLAVQEALRPVLEAEDVRSWGRGLQELEDAGDDVHGGRRLQLTSEDHADALRRVGRQLAARSLDPRAARAAAHIRRRRAERRRRRRRNAKMAAGGPERRGGGRGPERRGGGRGGRHGREDVGHRLLRGLRRDLPPLAAEDERRQGGELREQLPPRLGLLDLLELGQLVVPLEVGEDARHWRQVSRPVHLQHGPGRHELLPALPQGGPAGPPGRVRLVVALGLGGVGDLPREVHGPGRAGRPDRPRPGQARPGRQASSQAGKRQPARQPGR